MYAFVSHESACEVLRRLSVERRDLDADPVVSWPAKPRRLPRLGDCVATQASFRELEKVVDLAGLGIVTRPVDLLVPSKSAYSRGAATHFHVWSRPLPKHSMLRVHENLLVSGPELTVIELCGSQAKLDALLDAHVEAVRAERAVLCDLGIDELPVADHPLEWERTRRLVAAAVVACEFAGTYRLMPRAGAAYEIPPLMSCEGLGRVADEVGTLSAESRARRVSALAFDRSASPMETAVALMLTLPVDIGGFGLPKPELNMPVDVSSARGVLSERDEVTPDMRWLGRRVAVEYDSFERHGAGDYSQLTTDALRANALSSLGWRVMRVTPGVISSVARFSLLARQLAELLGVTLARPTEVQTLRRQRLFTELMPRRVGA